VNESVSGTGPLAGGQDVADGQQAAGGQVATGQIVTGQLVEPAAWLSLAEVAQRLDIGVNQVRQLIRDRSLLAVRRDGAPRVPAELIAPTVRKHLPGVLTLLHDAGYNDEETLPGFPAQALGGDKATEVKRRAQAVGF
jgi:hypothetical protein